MGLRDTLEPDPDNTGVGSFRSLHRFSSKPARSCFVHFETRGFYVQRSSRLPSPIIFYFHPTPDFFRDRELCFDCGGFSGGLCFAVHTRDGVRTKR
jgi:hypothetical protein